MQLTVPTCQTCQKKFNRRPVLSTYPHKAEMPYPGRKSFINKNLPAMVRKYSPKAWGDWRSVKGSAEHFCGARAGETLSGIRQIGGV